MFQWIQNSSLFILYFYTKEQELIQVYPYIMELNLRSVVLTDAEEVDLGTDPDNVDSDGDGYQDGREVTEGTNPTDRIYKSPIQPILPHHTKQLHLLQVGTPQQFFGGDLLPAIWGNNYLGMAHQCGEASTHIFIRINIGNLSIVY
jgi:hypothetical protein